jgi:hypothetical protein
MNNSSPQLNPQRSFHKNKKSDEFKNLGIIKKKIIIENLEEATPQKTINENLEKINYYIKSQAGRTFENKKKVNQDAYLSLCNIMGLNQYHIFGVLDGHGINNIFNIRHIRSFSLEPYKRILFELLYKYQ